MARPSGMSQRKKQIHNETLIKIRILKALADIKPYGILKHFYMIRLSRNLKRPNIISTSDVWKFLEVNYDLERFDRMADEDIKDLAFDFDDARMASGQK
jgi:hypothetical protein